MVLIKSRTVDREWENLTMDVPTRSRRCIGIHTCVYIYICTYIIRTYVCVYTHIHTCVYYIYIHYTHVHTYRYTIYVSLSMHRRATTTDRSVGTAGGRTPMNR